MTLIARRHLRINGSARRPGEPVPEFDDDPARRRKRSEYLDRGFIERVGDDAGVGSSGDGGTGAVIESEPAAEGDAGGSGQAGVPTPDGPGIDDLTAEEAIEGVRSGSLDPAEVLAAEQDRPQPRKTVIEAAEEMASDGDEDG